MKSSFTLVASLVVAGAVCVTAYGQTPTFKQSIPATSSGSTAAYAYFPTLSGLQPRIVGIIGTSDKAASVFSMQAGTIPQSISVSNAAGTNITVLRTNGITANDVIIIEGRNGITNATVYGFGSSTNVQLTTSTGWATLPNDQVYKLGSATTIKCGAATTVYQGDAIYVGGVGRPIMVKLDGTSACSLDSLTARYE